MGVDEFPATHRLVTLLNKPPVLTRAAILENTSIDGTATSCQEVIRFLGMAFWAEFFSPDAPSIQRFVAMRFANTMCTRRHMRTADLRPKKSKSTRAGIGHAAF